jgi:hypothetical protein
MVSKPIECYDKKKQLPELRLRRKTSNLGSPQTYEGSTSEVGSHKHHPGF